MKIAVTSQNLRTINGHAGKARRFLVYETECSGSIVRLPDIDLPKTMSIHEHPVGMPHPLDGVDMVITAGCGDGFRRKMSDRGIAIVATAESDPTIAVAAVAAGRPPPVPWQAACSKP